MDTIGVFNQFAKWLTSTGTSEVAVLLGVRPRFNLVDMVQNCHRMDAGLLASFIEQHQSIGLCAQQLRHNFAGTVQFDFQLAAEMSHGLQLQLTTPCFARLPDGSR